MIDVGLIGPGRVGRALARLLPREGYDLGPVLGSSLASSRRAVREMRRGRAAHNLTDFAGCRILLIAIPESALNDLLRRLAGSIPPTGVTALVTSAFLDGEGAENFRGGGGSLASLLPFQTFQRPPADLASVYFAVGGDAPAVRLARRLVRELGAEAQVAADGKLGRAAVANSLATETFVGLLDFALRQLTAAGFPRRRGLEALRVLIAGAFDDYMRSGRSARLGPLLREEPDDIRRRIAALAAADAPEAELYRQTLALTMKLLTDDGDLSFSPAFGVLRSDGAGALYSG